jgi:hypothetical protein
MCSGAVVLRGGPADGSVVDVAHVIGAAVLVAGDEFGREGDAAQYRLTGRCDGRGRPIFAFESFNRIVGRVERNEQP